jgi:MATE family multidrug resistance protein
MNRRTEIRETLSLALPIAFAQVALMTMGLVDAALVGRISDTELAAVSVGNSLTFAMCCPGMGVTMAVEPLASQAVGAGDVPRAWTSLRAGIVACLLLAVPTMLFAYASTLLLEPLGVDPSIIPAARRFVLARLPGIPSWLLFMAAKAYLEARGLTRPLLLGGWFANVLNFVAASLLIFGDRALLWVGLPAAGLPMLGSFGAGLGTSLSNTLLALIALGACYGARPEGASLFRGERAELVATTKKLLRVGIPIGLQLLTEVGVFALVSLLAGRLGARTSAAHQIALGLAAMTFMGVLGISAATAVRVGRAIGEGDERGPRRAGLVGLGLVTIYMSACALIFVVFARPLARIFTPDPAVLELSVSLLRIAALFQLADGIQGVASGALRGAADTRFASWANVACHWGVGLPLALLFGFTLERGAVGLWWGLSAGLGVVAAVLTLRFLRISSKKIAAV